MDLIENKEQIIDNCKYLIKNINDINVKKIINYGRCFLKCTYNNKIYFFPSKFIGYKNNTIEKYEEAKELHAIAVNLKDNSTKRIFDGGRTNTEIQKYFNKNFEENSILYNEYENFCNSLGIENIEIKSKNVKKFMILEEEIKDL